MESGDTKWRIVVGTLVLRPGDEVSWNADKSDMLFGLPVDMNDYFELNEGNLRKQKNLPNGLKLRVIRLQM
ncbi:MAG: hypothetical protein U5K72_15465 [Balneolaceae bacterium]|nr:hypothetical protein [Balneolaceae bacterium]